MQSQDKYDLVDLTKTSAQEPARPPKKRRTEPASNLTQWELLAEHLANKTDPNMLLGFAELQISSDASDSASESLTVRVHSKEDGSNARITFSWSERGQVMQGFWLLR